MGQAATHHRQHFDGRETAARSRCALLVGHRHPRGEAPMKARLIVVCVCVMLISAGGSWAEDSVEASARIAPAAVTAAVAVSAVATEEPAGPWIHPKFSEDVREKLQSAVRIAAEKIEEVEECGDLFARLGADGIVTLNTTLFFPVAANNRRDGICRQAAAYTKVGAKSTFVCPEFSRLSDERAAMFVVHEALHHAGLSEKPLDRRGMTSLEINTMVGKKCGF
jgi:hypothetical protein